MAMLKQKHCRFCKKLFMPNPRAKAKQYACRSPDCQKQRKRKNQGRWLERHPGYFRGRYENTKLWLKEHPGYITSYRQSHPEAREKHRVGARRRRERLKSLRVDIQDLISTQRTEVHKVKHKLPSVDIQDSLLRQLVVVTGLISMLRGVDIQDSIDLTMVGCYKRGYEMWGFGRREVLKLTG